MNKQNNTISSSTLVEIDVDVPDKTRFFAPLLVPPNVGARALPAPKRLEHISIFSNSANVNRTTITGSASTLTDSTDNPIFGAFSPRATYSTSGGDSRFTSNINTSAPINVLGRVIVTSVRNMSAASAGGSTFKIQLHSAGTPTAISANYHEIDMLVDGARFPFINAGVDWQKLSANTSRFSAVGTGADLSNIIFATYTIKSVAQTLPVIVDLGAISVYDTGVKKGIVTISMDGMYRSQYNNIFPILAAAGIPATVYAAAVSVNLRSEASQPWQTAQITGVTNVSGALIRLSFANNLVLTSNKYVAVQGIAGVTDNSVAITGLNIYQYTRIDAKTIDLIGTIFGGVWIDTEAYANFAVNQITGMDANPVDGLLRITCADAAVWPTKNTVNIVNVVSTGSTVNGVTLINEVEGSTTQFVRTGTLASAVTYTSGGFVIMGITSGSQFMTVRQLRNLQDNFGWQIASYTDRTNNQIDYTALNKDGVNRTYQNSQAYLMSLGFLGWQDCVYFNDTYVRDQHIYGFAKRYARTIRLFLGNVSAFKGETLPVGDTQMIRSFGVFSTTTVATITALIDDCIANKDWCHLVFHECDRTAAAVSGVAAGPFFGNGNNTLVFPIVGMQQVVAHINTKRAAGVLDVMTVEDALLAGSVGGGTQFSKSLPVAVTATASPMVYQNKNQERQQFLATGGTVSDLSFSRDGTTYYTIGSLSGGIVLSPGDYIKITYTIAPTITTTIL